MYGCPHMFGCLHMFGHPHMFRCPLYVLMMFGCSLYINNIKKACFARLRGCPYAPIHWDTPHMLDATCMFGWPPICLDISHMFGCPQYVWISPICLDTPICLDASLYVWMMCGCLLYIYNTKKACFVRLRGCPYVPIHLYAPYIWMHSLYIWMPPYVWMPHMFGWPPVCLDALHMFGCPLYVLMPPCLDTPMFGCPLYV